MTRTAKTGPKGPQDKKSSKGKRYESVSYRGIKGIRKDLKCKTFIVEKTIRGKRYSATFKTIREAADWKQNFHLALNFKPWKKQDNALKSLSELEIQPRETSKKNGEDFGYTFGDVWSLYVEKHLSRLELASYSLGLKYSQHFFRNLMDIPMVEINAHLVSSHLEAERDKAIRENNKKRYHFNGDLKYLKSFLNWYRENIDPMFVNPVLKRHQREGFIRNAPKRKKKMRKHELLAFFKALEGQGIFWRDFAETQFYFSGRVQEVAGLQWESVDFVDGEIEIENVAVWDNKKNFCTLKPSTKNGETRKVPMTQRLFEVLKRRRTDERPSVIDDVLRGKPTYNFVFHIEGRPLKYRMIQYRYNRALKEAGLGDKYSATHILRHTMANLVRERMGLEHAQAVGGWKTRALVENVYTETPTHLSQNALENIENFINTIDEEEAKRRLELTK